MDSLAWGITQGANLSSSPLLWSSGCSKTGCQESFMSIYNLNPSLQFEAMFNPDKVAGMSGSQRLNDADPKLNPSQDSSWKEDFIGQELRSSQYSNVPYALSPFGDDFRMIDRSKVVNSSLDQSLDCLLSATNSNTSTSMEDDGMSMILSDCRNLWSFRSPSCVEPENKTRNKQQEAYVSRDQAKTKTLKRGRVDDHVEKKDGCSSETGGFFSFSHPIDDSSTADGSDFQLLWENPPKCKKPRLEKRPCSSNISFQSPSGKPSIGEPDPEAIAQMKEMIYRAAAFRPVDFAFEVVEKPKRKNVRISTDPQTVAARQRREKISDRIRVLQRLVPGGTKMDTASMLDEAANYLKFLRSQVRALENLGHKFNSSSSSSGLSTPNLGFPLASSNYSFLPHMQSLFPSSLVQNSGQVPNPETSLKKR